LDSSESLVEKKKEIDMITKFSEFEKISMGFSLQELEQDEKNFKEKEKVTSISEYWEKKTCLDKI
jgi:hypothetical protein